MKKNREEEGGQRMAGTEMIFYLGNYDKAFPERWYLGIKRGGGVSDLKEEWLNLKTEGK